MSKPFAMVFPGQGSQSLGMLTELANQFKIIKPLFEEASDILQYDLWALVQAGPLSKLNQTEFTQPALLTSELAIYHCWREIGGPLPKIAAGHSLGEYSALVCAGVLEFSAAVRLVAKRGRYMQEAADGAMAVLVGLSNETVLALCEDCAENQILSPANYNSPGQVVVSGETAAISRLLALAKTKGAKIAKLLPVSVPSHCDLMQPAAENLKLELQATFFSEGQFPVIQNANLVSAKDPELMRNALIDQLTHSVRWVDTIHQLIALGISHCIECGPGNVLTGLNKRISENLITLPTDQPERLVEAFKAIS